MVVSDESELIFTIRNNPQVIIEPDSESNEQDQNSDTETKILAFVWKNGKLGAAYFNFHEKLVSYYYFNI